MKKRTKDGKAPLYIRITVNGERAEISANRDALLSHWDSKLQKIKGNNPEAIGINTHLASVKSSLLQHHSRLVTLGKIVTAQMLRKEYLGLTDERKSIEDAMTFFLNKYKEKVKTKVISDKTLEKYENVANKLRRFLLKEYKVKDLPLNDITSSFMEDFAHYLLTVCKLQHNTAMKKISLAKSIFIMAAKRGWMKSNPTREYVCRLEEKEPLRLEMNELYAICTKEILNNRLSEARDCYIFMCFTGYAYVDVSGLKEANVFIGLDGNKWITKNREKTDNTECVPLFPIPLQIIEKYKNHPKCKQSGKLLPVNSNQKFNEYLKEIAALCGVNKELTTHTARHTFATTVTLENGVPFETVSRMLGHNRLKSTQRYARVTRRKISENMKELKNKLLQNEFGELMQEENVYV